MCLRNYLVAVLMACAGPGLAAALEMSAQVDLDTKRVEAGANMQLEAVKAWALAVLQGQQTLLNNMNTCSKQQKFWNGTACVAPVYNMSNPSVAMNTYSLPLKWTFAYKTCTKKKLGICTRNDNFCQSSCVGSASASYSVRPETNSIVVTSYVCNGAGQVKNVGNGGC